LKEIAAMLKRPLLTFVVLVSACSGVAADEAGLAPDGWKREAVRAESAPRFWLHRSQGEASGDYELGLAGQGSEAVDGRWVRRQSVLAGKHYLFHAEVQARNVASPMRSVLARVLWLDARGKQIGEAEFPLTQSAATPDGWTVLSSTYEAPHAATQAQLELHLRWTAHGTAVWRRAGLTETKHPAARKVRLATVNHRPHNSKSPQENLLQFAGFIAEAARQKADIVCLPEGITLTGTGKKYADVAEPIPGPSTGFLGAHAKKHHLYLVAGLYERAGPVLYNTSVLIGRTGELVGKYRKVCLPREEIDGGMTPGADYPVFDTDFGRIAMMICWDVSYPEVARALAARGAEVLFLPIAGGNEVLVRARAIENQVHLVASGYDIPSAIYDRAGEPLAVARKDPEILVQEVDLNARRLWYWIGDWRARIWREAPPPAPGKQP
jgi:predicted amidohydrolase